MNVDEQKYVHISFLSKKLNRKNAFVANIIPVA